MLAQDGSERFVRFVLLVPSRARVCHFRTGRPSSSPGNQAIPMAARRAAPPCGGFVICLAALISAASRSLAASRLPTGLPKSFSSVGFRAIYDSSSYAPLHRTAAVRRSVRRNRTDRPRRPRLVQRILPCGLPPGDCMSTRGHGAARGRRTVTGGSGRMSPAAEPARPGPEPPGSRAGSMTVDEAGLSDRTDRRRYQGRHAGGAVGNPIHCPAVEPADIQSSKRRVVWPNGASAVCLSGEEPERARGLNVDTIWADELACWQRAEQTWNMAMWLYGPEPTRGH